MRGSGCGSAAASRARFWHANVGKRQVKAPKVYLRDSGMLHALLRLTDREALLGHPIAGFSWEGFALEHVLRVTGIADAYFWGTYGGAELDLLFLHEGRWYAWNSNSQMRQPLRGPCASP